MRVIYLLLVSFFVSLNAWADNSFEPLLNTVTLELNSEQWVTTQTALVSIGVNATVTGGGLEKIQSTVLSKLNQIAKGEWHIISFNRSLSQSGLEQVQISSQARLPSSDLGGLRDRTKAITKPGETYTLDNVEFIPSESELRTANTNLRNVIYQQAKNEIDVLNKVNPEQHYYIHTIDFVGRMTPPPQPMMYKAGGIGAMASNAATISVGNKLFITATVVLASAPSPEVTKIVHA